MIDPVQLPILMKAIDFIFEEGRKILEERRERRKTASPAEEEKESDPAKEIVPAQPEKSIEFKQEFLTSKIDELLWQNHEQEVAHLVRLLETHTRNYHIASEQYAKWGSALVPPIVLHNLTEAENSTLETLRRLEKILSKVYEKEIPPSQ